MTGDTERGRHSRLQMAALRVWRWTGILVIHGSVASAGCWYGGLADASVERPMGMGGAVAYVPVFLLLIAIALAVAALLLEQRRRWVPVAEQSQLVFEGDPQQGWRLEGQQILRKRLLSARRRADEAGEALADAERDMQTAAWQCVASGMASSDTGVSDAWSSPAVVSAPKITGDIYPLPSAVAASCTRMILIASCSRTCWASGRTGPPDLKNNGRRPPRFVPLSDPL